MDQKIELLCRKLGIDENTLNVMLETGKITKEEVELIAAKAYQDDLMNNTLLANFQDNLEAFKKYNTAIYEKFKDYRPKRSFDFFSCDDGSVNLQYVDDQEFLYKSTTPKAYCQEQVDNLSKTLYFEFLRYTKQVDDCGQIHYRYVNEVVDLIESIDKDLLGARADDIEAIPHVVLLGVGLGYIVEMLYSRFDIGNMIIIEPDPDIFYASLYSFNWAALIEFIQENNNRLTFMIDKTSEEYFYALSNYYHSNGCFLSAFKCVISSYKSKAIDDFAVKVYPKFYMFSQLHGFIDDILFGLSNGVHCINAGSNLVRNDVLLTKEQQSYPVFIVGNGPSLDDDMAFLRKNQDRAVIIACGTAIDSLYHAGVKPDFYVATERTAHVAESLAMFDGTDFLDDVVLLTANMVHPYTLKYFKKNMVFAKANEFLLPALHANCGDMTRFAKWKSIQHINPLVSNAGAAVALHLGFKELYLFGIDNGKAVSKKLSHSQSSELYNGRYQVPEYGTEYNNISIGNFGNEIETNLLYATSCEFLSLLMEAVKDEATCYNCSDGLVIRQTISKHSSDIDLSDRPLPDKKELVRYMLEDMTFKAHLSDEEIKKAFNTERFDYLVNMLISSLKKDFVNRKEFTFTLQELSGILRKLVYGPDVLYASTVDSSTQFFFEQASMLCYRIKDEKKAMYYANKVIKLYLNLLEDSKYLFTFMPNYIQSEHLKLIHNRIGLDHEGSKAPYYDTPYTLKKVGEMGGTKVKFVKRYE